MAAQREVERWGRFETALEGPREGNPFEEVALSAIFRQGHREVEAPGFYDGEGVYRVRFLPDLIGEWSYRTRSDHDALDGIVGSFTCTPPSEGNHGPVSVRDTFHFAYADGTPYYPIGTTCYAWNHQGDALEATTLATLDDAPFNKMRMCVFPKDYRYNRNEPPCDAFEKTADGGWDFHRFVPEYFRRLERRVADLGDRGIEADVILFHPYDRWGYATMDADTDDRYLRYVVARLWAYRNVWWSFANEYELMKSKTVADWDRFFKIVQAHDPAQHLRSIHNWDAKVFYDHGKPWVTHQSIQHSDVHRTAEWRSLYRKPVVIDECCYEGDIPEGWGNISARELVHRFWEGTVRGGYVGHGETYLHPDDILWWSKGGVLHGESPARIAFLRALVEDGPPAGLEPVGIGAGDAAAKGTNYYLTYFGVRQPGRVTLKMPANGRYTAEIIDTWKMTVESVDGVFEGTFELALPRRSHLALRLQRAG